MTLRSNGNNRKVPAEQAHSDSLSHLLAQLIHREMSFLSMESIKDLISLTATADLHQRIFFLGVLQSGDCFLALYM